MSATVGELDVRLNLELSRLDTQITAANKKIANMGRRMNSDISRAARSINTALSTLGVGIGVGALTAFGKSILDLGGKINDLSMQAGIGTDAFQTLAAVGKESGVSGEQIAQAFTRMGSTIQEAAEGSKTAAESLRKLGLTAAGLKALKPEEQFEALAIKIVTATDKAEAYNAALEILGSKTAPKLREVLARLGAEGFDKLSESTASVRFTPEQIKTLDDAGDKLQRIADVLKVFSAKKFLDMADAASAMAKRISASKLDALVVGASGPAAWYLYYKETMAKESAARGGGSTRNPGLSRSPDRTQANAEQAILLERMRAAEEAALKLEIEQSDELSRQRVIMQAVVEQEELREKSRASGLAILKEQAELEKAQLEYAERFGPDYSAIKEVESSVTVPDLKDFERFQDQVFQIFDNVGDRAAATFADMVLTGENAFKSLVDSVARAALEMVARLAIINPLMNVVFGLGGAGAGAALPTLFSTFGGAKAGGGDVRGGMDYLVGEKGPEIFSPNTSGTIIPNHALGGGGGGVTNHYAIDARGASVDAVRELRQMMASLSASVEPRAVAAVRDSDRRRK
jgi:hypothetical protein